MLTREQVLDGYACIDGFHEHRRGVNISCGCICHARQELIVLSLCDYSGVWSQPFVEAGYRVIRADLAYEPGERQMGERLWTVGCDLTRYDFPWIPWAVLAAPSCTTFCRPGARWWGEHDASGQTQRDVALFRACLRLCQRASSWWALENPPGRQRRLMPELPGPAWQFQPWEYGDPWVKQTYIWGTATKPPVVCPVTPEPTRQTPNGRWQGRIAFMSSSWKREREKTPSGFARAFYEANCAGH